MPQRQDAPSRRPKTLLSESEQMQVPPLPRLQLAPTSAEEIQRQMFPTPIKSLPLHERPCLPGQLRWCMFCKWDPYKVVTIACDGHGDTYPVSKCFRMHPGHLIWCSHNFVRSPWFQGIGLMVLVLTQKIWVPVGQCSLPSCDPVCTSAKSRTL